MGKNQSQNPMSTTQNFHYSSDDSDETHSDISKAHETSKNYDVAFLAADVLVYEDPVTKEKKTMNQE